MFLLFYWNEMENFQEIALFLDKTVAMKKLTENLFSRMMGVFFILLISLTAFAQDVADSDLSNRAGTNKNFRDQWWLFGVIGLVVLVILIVYARRRGRKAP